MPPLSNGQRRALAMSTPYYNQLDYERSGVTEDDYRIDDGVGFDNDAASVDATEDDLGNMADYDTFDTFPNAELKGLGEPGENIGRLAALHDCRCAQTGVGGVLSDLFDLGAGFSFTDPSTYDQYDNSGSSSGAAPAATGGGFWDSVLGVIGKGATSAADAGIKRLSTSIAGGAPVLPKPRMTVFGVPVLYVGIAGAALAAVLLLRRRR